MKFNKVIFPLAGALFFCGMNLLRADDNSWPDMNRISLGYRMGVNISAKFKNIGATPFANNPSVTGKSYQNGFVGTDSTGNAGGATTYWGYQNASQVQDGNAVLVMNSANSGALGSDVNNSPYHGLEVTYDHEIAQKGKCRWGYELAFSWADFSAHQTVVAPAGMLTADAFQLGYTPPTAPYTGPQTAGPFEPLLGTTATQLPVTVASSLDANLYGIRVGPLVDWPLNKHLMLSFSAGLSLTIVDGDYSYRESYMTPGGTLISSGGYASKVAAVPGGYASAQVLLKLAKHVDAFTGLQYQGSSSYEIIAGDKQAQIDFAGAFYWTCGLSYSF